MYYVKEAVRVDLVELAIDTGNPLEAVTAELYTSAVTPNETCTKASMDAIKAAFTGYAAIVIVWTAVGIAPNRNPYTQSQNLHWLCTSAPVSPVNCYGVYYHDTTDLLAIDPFPAPVVVDEALDPVDWIATFP
jgi:hypothetical protein